MKYLVFRPDAIRRRDNSRQLNNSCFPIEVEYASHATPEEIVRRALDSINEGYVGLYTYAVVPLHDAELVTFRKPEPKYEVVTRPYC